MDYVVEVYDKTLSVVGWLWVRPLDQKFSPNILSCANSNSSVVLHTVSLQM